jgi:hypothetical protein
MIAAFSTISLVLGTTIAYMAIRHREHEVVLETVGGILLIAGLGIIGYALEAVLGSP